MVEFSFKESCSLKILCVSVERSRKPCWQLCQPQIKFSYHHKVLTLGHKVPNACHKLRQSFPCPSCPNFFLVLQLTKYFCFPIFLSFSFCSADKIFYFLSLTNKPKIGFDRCTRSTLVFAFSFAFGTVEAIWSIIGQQVTKS